MIPIKNADPVEPSTLNDSLTRWRALAPSALPREPVVRIRPARSSYASGLRELWEHRDLLYFLTWRDLKVRYNQTILGAAWVVLQPLLMTIVFTIFLGRLVGVPSDGAPYPVFAYAGLLLWAFFYNSVLSSSHSLVANAHMITRVYFPRLTLPIAAVAVRLVDFLIASVILIALMSYYGVRPSLNMLMLPVAIAQLTLLTLGLGMLFSALNARYRDTGTLLPVLLQLWMFASPILYPSSIVPQGWRTAYALNPLAGITEAFRASLFGVPFDWAALLISSILTLIVLAFSVFVFGRMEEGFADII